MCTGNPPGLPPLLGSLLGGQATTRLACLHYTQLCGDGVALYPLALVMPSYIDQVQTGRQDGGADGFDHDGLSRYSTNSGVAIGMTRTEAIVHGLHDREDLRRYHQDMVYRTRTYPLHGRCVRFDLAAGRQLPGCASVAFDDTARCDHDPRLGR